MSCSKAAKREKKGERLTCFRSIPEIGVIGIFDKSRVGAGGKGELVLLERIGFNFHFSLASV